LVDRSVASIASGRRGNVASLLIDDRETCRGCGPPPGGCCMSVLALGPFEPDSKAITSKRDINQGDKLTSKPRLDDPLAQPAIVHIQLIDLLRIQRAPFQRALPEPDICRAQRWWIPRNDLPPARHLPRAQARVWFRMRVVGVRIPARWRQRRCPSPWAPLAPPARAARTHKAAA
jgi:hypothetical protein